MDYERVEKLLRDELARTHFPLVRIRDATVGHMKGVERYARLPVAGDRIYVEGDNIPHNVTLVHQYPVSVTSPALGGDARLKQADVFINALQAQAQQPTSSNTPYAVGGILAALAVAGGVAWYLSTRPGASSTPGTAPQAFPSTSPQQVLPIPPPTSPLNQAILNQIQAGTAKAATGSTPIRITFSDGSYELISSDGSAVSHQVNGTVLQTWPVGSYVGFPSFVSQIRTLEGKSTGVIEHALTHPLPVAAPGASRPTPSSPGGAPPAAGPGGPAGMVQGVMGQAQGALSAIQSGNPGQILGAASKALGSVPGLGSVLGGLGGSGGLGALGGGGLGGLTSSVPGLGNALGGGGGSSDSSSDSSGGDSSSVDLSGDGS